MEFVEINADRKPRLTGGRRGAPVLFPGGNAVSNNLVPVSQLPPSAGSLDAVFNTLGKKMRAKKSGGASLEAVLHHPSDHQAQFDKILNAAKGGKRGRPKKGGAVSIDKDGKYHYSGSDDPRFFNKYKGGALLKNPDGTYTGVGSDSMNWRRIGGRSVVGPSPGQFHHQIIPYGGQMSKYVPSHHHGANTSIGTNYQLSQFGGSAAQPIGNVATTLSPALSGMSVGAGRSVLPKGKNLKKLLKVMVQGRKHCCGGAFLGDAWETVKGIATGLYHEFGPQIFETGKEVLLKALEEGAKHYIHGGKDGGGFWGDVLDGLKSVGTFLWDTLKEVLNSAVVKEIEHELLNQGLALAKQYALGKLQSGAPAPAPVEAVAEYSGKGMPGRGGHGIKPKYAGGGEYDNYISYEQYEAMNKQQKEDFVTKLLEQGDKYALSLVQQYELKASGYQDIISHAIQKINGSGAGMPGRGGHGIKPKKGGWIIKNPDGTYIDYDPSKIKKSQTTETQHMKIPDDPNAWYNKWEKMGSGRKQLPHSGAKRNSARGAIVAEVMKKQGLSLPMASKYVKEHGLY